MLPVEIGELVGVTSLAEAAFFDDAFGLAAENAAIWYAGGEENAEAFVLLMTMRLSC
jgi:hypothetical protein